MAADHTLLDALSCLSVTPESISYIRSLGIDEKLIKPACDFIAVALADFFQGPIGNVFRLSPDGKPAVVIGARTARREEPSDLIAWPLYGPRRDFWASLHLDVDLLGFPAVLSNLRAAKPLRLHRTPEDWLLAGFDGSCVVNRRWGGHWLNKLPGPLVCEDLDHGWEVAAMLRPYGKETLVHVPAPELRGAA